MTRILTLILLALVGLGAQAQTLTPQQRTALAADISIAQHASNPTNARWGILYNNTDANKRALAFLDFGSASDLSSGAFTFNFQGASTDVLALTQA